MYVPIVQSPRSSILHDKLSNEISIAKRVAKFNHLRSKQLGKDYRNKNRMPPRRQSAKASDIYTNK
jgi:hypothetical protein